MVESPRGPQLKAQNKTSRESNAKSALAESAKPKKSFVDADNFKFSNQAEQKKKEEPPKQELVPKKSMLKQPTRQSSTDKAFSVDRVNYNDK